ncbi:hypothetical protein EN45_007750 [Penicillium chrysogenum]|uniref:Uncharacterized protein n=1 Tax=Penicillium chrysogenum TaxID=5076 RepID=A0A167VLF1_PENCH|nr:hypothetical protein EN45_007750 [Penicillium chrysogenum]
MSALVAASQTLVRHLPNSRSTSQNETPDRQHRSSGQSFLPSWPISKHLSKGKTTQAYGRRAGGVARSDLVRGGRRMLWRLSGNRHMQVLLDFVVFMTIWEVFREEFRSHTPSTFSEAVHPLLVYLGIRSPHQTRGQRLLRLLRRYGLGVRSAMFLGRRMRHWLMTARSFVGGLTLPRVRLPRSVHTSLDSCEDVSVVERGLVETPLWLVSASSAKHTKHTHSVGREIHVLPKQQSHF